jgi:diguanylate cyclase (GGDEF)-like protein
MSLGLFTAAGLAVDGSASAREPLAADRLEALVRERVSAALVDASVRYAEERGRLIDALDAGADREAALRTLLEGSTEALLVLDENGVPRHMNAQARRLFGAVGEGGLPLPGPWAPGRRAQVDVVDAQGGERQLELRVETCAWDGRPARLLTLRDLGERRDDQAEPGRSAMCDALTGLPNRTLLLDRLRQALALSARVARVPAMLYIDLDQFKEVNDSLGHDAGDQVLRVVAQRLAGALRPGDTLARLSGDEFLVLLPDLARADDAAAVAHKLIEAAAAPYEVAGRQLYCSCSIGVAVADTSTEPQALIQRANLAMHEAKRVGRSNVQCYVDALAVRAGERLEMRTQLQAAIARHEFTLEYQPQLDLATQRVCGVEALLRWRHPTLGTIAPSRFVQVAEETGQIVAIGDWVLDEACRQQRQWLDSGLFDGWVAVNVSGVQVRRPGFVERVEAVLARHGLPAARLELELTESVMMNCAGATLDTLTRLRALGVRLSIDDFGTGFSSLAYLKRMPIDKVKIDRSFVNDITCDSNDASITLSVIAIAHHLRLRVVAEGVETPAQLAYLRRHRCDEVQGFLVAQPLPPPALERLVREFRPPQAALAGDDDGAPTLLLVDDEPNILRALTRTLRRDGYRILTAGSARQAFELLAENEVQVVLSDQRMPAMSGTDFLGEVKSLYPDTVRLVLSGYTDLAAVTEAINRGAIYRFLTKPWVDEQLREHVREAFAHGRQQATARPA